MGRAWISPLLALAACGGAELVPIAAPSPGAAVVLARSSPSPELVAFDVEGGYLERVEVDEGMSVEAFVYDAPLASLRVPAGALAPSPTGVALPSPPRRFALDRGVDPPAWRETSSTPLFDGFRLDLISPCRRFAVTTVDFPPGRTAFLEPLPDGRLVHGLLRNDERLQVDVLDASGALEPKGILEGYTIITGQYFEGDLWLGGHGGWLVRVPLDDLASARTATRSPSEQPIRGLDVSPDGAVLTIAGGGRIERFDGARWTVLRDLPDNANDEVAVLALPSGERLLATASEREVVRERDGALSVEPIVGSDAPLGLALLGGRPVALLTAGVIAAQRGASWQTLHELPVDIDLYDTIDLEGGFLVGGRDGLLREWNDVLGTTCDNLELERPGSNEFIRRIGDAIAIGGYPVRRVTPGRVWLLRADPPG